MVAIIDVDSIIWALAWIYKDTEREELLQEVLRERLRQIFDESGATDYLIVVGCGGCFRDKLYDVREYKGNRKEKPDWYIRLAPYMEETLAKEYGAVSKEGFEADDLVSMAAFGLRTSGREYMVCSPDKDMKQIPGWHMNVREEELVLREISDDEARHYFYLQMLVGDSGDNIEGVRGIGKVKAEKLLYPDTSKPVDPDSWPAIVEKAYIDKYGAEQGLDMYRKTFYTILLVRPGHTHYDGEVEKWLLEQIKPIP